MKKWVIRGGARLLGDVHVSGSKNAALPILASALLAPGRSTYRNVPLLRDVSTMRRLLEGLGADTRGGPVTFVDTSNVRKLEAPDDSVKSMRAGVLVMGPLLARFGRARVWMPGGCTIGVRPIDQHLKGLAAMGAAVEVENGYVSVRARRLRGAAVVFDLVTVTGTENLMMAAALARGRTTLENAAREPEVEELARVLNKMGARIRGAGTPVINIEGVDELQPVDHAIIPDRIEAGTMMLAAAVTRGDVLVRDCLPEHLETVLSKLRAAGVEVSAEQGGIRARGRRDYRPGDVATRPYPGFPTDLQAQLLVLMALSRGQSVLTETVFENRFMHVAELRRLGADIAVDGRAAVVRGPCRLTGAEVAATDLRASACLLLAGLAARGTTEVIGADQIERGYERLDAKLAALGADIRRAGAVA